MQTTRRRSTSQRNSTANQTNALIANVRTHLTSRRGRKYDTSGYNYYSFDVNYNNEPDVYTYYFKARSEKEVARATGVDIECISKCSDEEITRAIRHGKHIDIVVSGKLIEQEEL